MRAWLRVNADMPRHPKVVHLPSDAARWAFMATLCEAKVQTPAGEWASERHYRHCVGSSVARWLPALVGAGLVERDAERVVIHDWQDYQADPTGTARSRRARSVAATLRNDSATAVQRDATLDIDIDTDKDTMPSGIGADTPLGLLVDEYLSLRRRLPSDRQRAILADYLDTFDVTGLARGIGAMRGRPDDPLQALLDDLKAHRRERTDAAVAAVQEARTRGKRSGLPPQTVELLRLMEQAKGGAA